MVVVTMQRGSARRIVAIALFVLIPLVFAILAFLVPSDGQDEVASIPAPETTLTLVRQALMKGTSGVAARPPTNRAEPVKDGPR